MQEIIKPVDKSILEKELNPETFIRKTNNGSNELYIVDAHNAPGVMDEIGRLRELTFRQAGGGTGKASDIDDFDTVKGGYKQLIVWSPEDKEILGGYRFLVCRGMGAEAKEKLATTKLFNFSDEFYEDYVPYMIELGRSFIQPFFQSTGQSRKGLFALDNLWDGLGALIVDNPDMKYFFGKVTMYRQFNTYARNLILHFLNKYFYDKKKLVVPLKPLDNEMSLEEVNKVLTGGDYTENLKILSQVVRKHGENIPPLINSYMNLSPSMNVFGTVINPYFGNVEETGIMITIADIYEKKAERHILGYSKD